MLHGVRFIETQKNRLAVATAEPRDSATFNGYLEATGSAVVHLVSGDIVDIACTPANTILTYTSFTGFLLQPD